MPTKIRALRLTGLAAALLFGQGLPALAGAQQAATTATPQSAHDSQEPVPVSDAQYGRVPAKQVPKPRILPPNAGKGPPVGAYRLIRYNDVYKGQDTGPLHAWKNRPIGDTGDVTLTLFGEERVRSVWQTWNSYTGAGERDQRFMLLRHQYGADLHVGEGLRFFGQLISGQQFGSNYPRPESPRQSNEVDLSQAFIEANHKTGSGTLGVRAGRQQVHFGTGQVFALQAAPNVERNFDGVRGYFDSPGFKLDAFLMRPVVYGRHSFDDDTDDDTSIWGLYGSMPLVRKQGLSINLDPIYVGQRDGSLAFNRLSGAETRHTFATRFWGKWGAAGIDYTVLYQTGSFDERNIRASAVMTTTSFNLGQDRDAPVLAFNLDMASGGKRDGSTVKTYNPLYMSGEYVSLNGFMSLSNMYSFAPSLSFRLPHDLSLEIYDRLYWRYSTDDAVYGQNFSTLAPSLRTDARYTGQQPAVDLRWQASPNLQLRGSGAYFEPSSKMRAAGLRHTPTFRIDLTYIF